MRCWLHFSSAFEACGEIGNQVRVIFNAYRDPQQRSADSRPQPGRFFHTGVRHARRVGDETLNAAQGFGQGEALKPGEKRTDGRFAAGDFTPPDFAAQCEALIEVAPPVLAASTSRGESAT